ncbi:hypothetical protein INR49_015338 [Caranx melampygus]|nr:hypothetical protein INR49_015338 [Caranx melampygus]
MAKPNDLKFFLESSLNEIFKATVSDILDSVDRTLSEYQGTIQRIESENEGLKRRLLAHESREFAARVDAHGQDDPEKEWSSGPITSTQGSFKMSICSSDKKSCRRKHKDKLRGSTNHNVESSCVKTSDVSLSTQTLVPVKAEPGLDETGAMDLSQPSSLFNLLMKPVKSENTEVGCDSHDAFAPLLPSSGSDQDSRGSDSEVKVTIVSDTYMQDDGQFIKTEEEEQNGVLRVHLISAGPGLPQRPENHNVAEDHKGKRCEDHRREDLLKVDDVSYTFGSSVGQSDQPHHHGQDCSVLTVLELSEGDWVDHSHVPVQADAGEKEWRGVFHAIEEAKDVPGAAGGEEDDVGQLQRRDEAEEHV